MELSETISVLFTYSHTRGVFTGHFTNGTTFDFIAAADSPLPTKLRNSLQALMQKEHTRFKAQARPDKGDTDEEWEKTLATIKEYEERNGVTRQATRKKKEPKRAVKITGINLKDLKL